jgi:hypothetical protein
MNKNLFEKFDAETLDLNEQLVHTGGTNTNTSHHSPGHGVVPNDITICTDHNGRRECYTYDQLK